MKVVVIDTEVQDEMTLLKLVSMIYQEEDGQFLFPENDWHVIHAVLNVIFKALKSGVKISNMAQQEIERCVEAFSKSGNGNVKE